MSSTFQEYTLDTLNVEGDLYHIYSLERASQRIGDISRLPKSMKILLENLLRWQDDDTVTEEDIRAIADWQNEAHVNRDIVWKPVRVLMQDFTGVPAIVDLAAMREAVKQLGGNPSQVNPISPVDLVIDHSVIVDHFGNDRAFEENVHVEMERNHERYLFLRWGQTSFNQFRVVPPGTGICHQVNLEYLGKTVWYEEKNGKKIAYPDTLVGTDSHTTMINALGILGWGVGGIEAEAAMLGQPLSMLIPDVVGFKLKGKLRAGITATDVVLSVTQMLRKHGVVGKFVEFYGEGLDELSLADRATISNMAPEFGATCGFFPIDQITLNYMQLTGRSQKQLRLIEAYSKAQGLWRNPGDVPVFTSTLELALEDVEPCLAGPKRPQDRVPLADVASAFENSKGIDVNSQPYLKAPSSHVVKDGDVVIAAITSCTNTSNPGILMAAGLLAKKAVALGLRTQPWVKTSLAPGSRTVSDYLTKANLMPALETLGFNLVGYGCTTCIGNSGPLAEDIEKTITEDDLTVSAVLSGNRNFEGRIHPLVKTNWLASPPLVVAYAIVGNIKINLTQDPIGTDQAGKSIYLKDIWPSSEEIANAMQNVSTMMFLHAYEGVFEGTEAWKKLTVQKTLTYDWPPNSTYIRFPPFFTGMEKKPTPIKDIEGARILAILGDSITTDHISPAGSIPTESPAGHYLLQQGVKPEDFNAYGTRRGNHEVMMRGTFANIRIRNEMLISVEGGMTRMDPHGPLVSIYDAAMAYKKNRISLVVIAGKEYGSGSSRDWAAKGPSLLGVRVVIAESFERIHRTNLIGMGILPLEFPQGVTRKTLNLSGYETIQIKNVDTLTPKCPVIVKLIREDKQEEILEMTCRIDTSNELTYYRHGGILHYVIRTMVEGG